MKQHALQIQNLTMLVYPLQIVTYSQLLMKQNQFTYGKKEESILYSPYQAILL